MNLYPVTFELARFFIWTTLLCVSVNCLYRFTPIVQWIKQGSIRLVGKVSFPRKWIDSTVTVYPPIRKVDMRHFIYKFKFSVFIIFLNVYTFFFTNDIGWGEINPGILESRGFSYQNFMQHKWFILVSSNFVHFHLLHLSVNMLMLVAFTGSLELLMGSSFAAICYLVSMNSNLPNGLILLPILKAFLPDMWLKTIQYVDVGASLGIIGTLGALSRVLIKPMRVTVLILVIGGTFVGAFYIQNLFGLDHACSAGLGYFCASYLLRKKKLEMTSPSIEIEYTSPNVKKIA